jgi:hypothetical protein
MIRRCTIVIHQRLVRLVMQQQLVLQYYQHPFPPGGHWIVQVVVHGRDACRSPTQHPTSWAACWGARGQC